MVAGGISVFIHAANISYDINSVFHGYSGPICVVIPDSITEIGALAFKCCNGLTSVVIPDGVTEIGALAFFSCSGLTSVVIPDSVTKIGNGAFFKCDNLIDVSLPEHIDIDVSQVFSNSDKLKITYRKTN